MSSRFPTTSVAAILGIPRRDAGERLHSVERIASRYWEPIYHYVRIHWRLTAEDAEDVVQTFFAQEIEKRILGRFDPARARFRTYLRLCVDGFVSNWIRSGRRLTRGGPSSNVCVLSEAAERALQTGELPADAEPEEIFYRQWLRYLLEDAAIELQGACATAGREMDFQVFKTYVLDPMASGEMPTRSAVAAKIGVSGRDVKKALDFARVRFRTILSGRLRGTTQGDVEYQDEARKLAERVRL